MLVDRQTLMNGLTHDIGNPERTSPLLIDSEGNVLKQTAESNAVDMQDNEGAEVESEPGKLTLQCRWDEEEKSAYPTSSDRVPVSLYRCMSTDMPRFLTAYVPTVSLQVPL